MPAIDRDAGTADQPMLSVLPDCPPCSGVVMIHGLGDHPMRHTEIGTALAERGCAFVAPDLPGHGVAKGRRGHIADVADVDEAIAVGLAKLRELVPGCPLGIAGHSMGGLLVLDHFARGGADGFSWVWLSSSLVHPAHGKPAWLQLAGRLLSKIWPSLTITSGVRPGDSFQGAADLDVIARERASGTHNRMSVGWGTELIRAGERVSAAAPRLFENMRVLMTHGDADRVCPLHYAKSLFETLPSGDKQFFTIDGAKHEPWHDPTVRTQICDLIVEGLADSVRGEPASDDASS